MRTIKMIIAPWVRECGKGKYLSPTLGPEGPSFHPIYMRICLRNGSSQWIKRTTSPSLGGNRKSMSLCRPQAVSNGRHRWQSMANEWWALSAAAEVLAPSIRTKRRRPHLPALAVRVSFLFRLVRHFRMRIDVTDSFHFSPTPYSSDFRLPFLYFILVTLSQFGQKRPGIINFVFAS